MRVEIIKWGRGNQKWPKNSDVFYGRPKKLIDFVLVFLEGKNLKIPSDIQPPLPFILLIKSLLSTINYFPLPVSKEHICLNSIIKKIINHQRPLNRGTLFLLFIMGLNLKYLQILSHFYLSSCSKNLCCIASILFLYPC